MKQKVPKISSKNIRYNWMRKILHVDRRQKQNHKEENLLTLHRESFSLKKGIGSILSQGNIFFPIMWHRRKYSIFFVNHNKCIGIEKNLQNQFPQSIHWSDVRWKSCLTAGRGVKKRFQNCTDDSGTFFLTLNRNSRRDF